jgi:hypothetical protein
MSETGTQQRVQRPAYEPGYDVYSGRRIVRSETAAWLEDWPVRRARMARGTSDYDPLHGHE